MNTNATASPMPKNKVQFPKGLSLSPFLEHYGSEPQCEQALFEARWPDGLACPRCGSHKFCRLSSRRATFQCNRCKRQLSLLAGTLFQATKLPLTSWFLAIYLLSQTKNGISALELGRKLGVNNNTAWLLKHKLMQAMRERDRRYRLHGTVQLDDAYLGRENPGGKRGRGSQNKTPLLVAVQVTDDGQPVLLKLSVVPGFRKQEVERWASEKLQPGTVVHTDGLGLLPRGGGGRLPAQAARDRRRQGRLRGPRPALGEHGPGEREALPGRHLPSLGAALRGALPGPVPVPLQSPLRPGGPAAEAAAGGSDGSAAAAADPDVQRGLTGWGRPQRCDAPGADATARRERHLPALRPHNGLRGERTPPATPGSLACRLIPCLSGARPSTEERRSHPFWPSTRMQLLGNQVLDCWAINLAS